MEVIKIFSAFAGYDAMLLALKRLVKNYPDFSFECVGYSEIDKYACIAHDALHPAIKSYGDITAVDWSTVPDFDILRYCGLDADTRNDEAHAYLVGWIAKCCEEVKNKKTKK